MAQPARSASDRSSQEVHNASVGIVDEDHSELSRRIVHAFLPPVFQAPQEIAKRDIVPLMNAGRYTFTINARFTGGPNSTEAEAPAKLTETGRNL